MQYFRLCCCALLLFLIHLPGSAQKILQIERYGRAKTDKFFVGDPITYRIKGEEVWHTRYLEDLLIERELIVFDDRYVSMDDIEAIRYDRPWTRAASISLYTFGAAWSGFALVGTLTDGNPETSYRASDAIVTGVSVGVAFLVSQLLDKRTITFGKRRRLRMIDISF